VTNPFLESPRFPSCPSLGYTSRPRYENVKIRKASGALDRFRLWDYPLHDFICTVGPRAEGEISRLLEFYHALGGDYSGFRFKDYADFKSCYTDETPGDDQPLELITGDSYQMVKEYVAGTRTQSRFIRKPRAETITIYDDGVLVNPSGYTLDASTGVVTFTSPPSGPVTWGGEFDVPVMFQGELPVEIINYRAQSVTFGLEELRTEGLEEEGS
jgi:uncharacterized protein (TIGR02217 family)